MNAISHTEVVNLLSGWEQQNKKIAVLGFNAAFTMSSRNSRITLCLDDMLQLTFGEDSILRFFLRGASFWPADRRDIPADSGDWFAGFERGVQLKFANPEMQCFLFVSEHK